MSRSSLGNKRDSAKSHIGPLHAFLTTHDVSLMHNWSVPYIRRSAASSHPHRPMNDSIDGWTRIKCRTFIRTMIHLHIHCMPIYTMIIIWSSNPALQTGRQVFIPHEKMIRYPSSTEYCWKSSTISASFKGDRAIDNFAGAAARSYIAWA